VKPATTAPPAPDSARTLFGDGLPLAERYVAWLAGPGVERGLLGPREVSRLWERHVLNCAVLAPLVPAEAHVGDVGSGAGLPGIVLAILRPDLSVVLVEPLLRRVDFLREVVGDLELTSVQVVRDRAEQVQSSRFSVVTARAVAPLDRLLGWTLPLLGPGGELLAMKGASAAEELEGAAATLARWKIEEAQVLQVGVGVVDPLTTVVRVRLPAEASR
jgi:16S rRNA (guanine527-N7)-methyltransferase